MKTVALEKTDLTDCVSQAQSGRVIVTRKGQPIALVVSVAGLDREQLELGSDDSFWKLVRSRREEKTISRAELETVVASKLRKSKSSQRKSTR